MDAIRYGEDKALLLPPEALRILADSIYLPTPQRLTGRIQAWFDDPLVRVFFCVQESGVNGLLILRQMDGSAEILSIAVTPERRRRWIGRCLIETASQALKTPVILAETDVEAVEFYRRAGFSIRSLGEKYPGAERFACRYSAVHYDRGGRI